MVDEWQMEEHGIEIELFKKGHERFFFDQMIPSGSSWLLGVKVK